MTVPAFVKIWLACFSDSVGFFQLCSCSSPFQNAMVLFCIDVQGFFRRFGFSRWTVREWRCSCRLCRGRTVLFPVEISGLCRHFVSNCPVALPLHTLAGMPRDGVVVHHSPRLDGRSNCFQVTDLLQPSRSIPYREVAVENRYS